MRTRKKLRIALTTLWEAMDLLDDWQIAHRLYDVYLSKLQDLTRAFDMRTATLPSGEGPIDWVAVSIEEPEDVQDGSAEEAGFDLMDSLERLPPSAISDPEDEETTP